MDISPPKLNLITHNRTILLIYIIPFNSLIVILCYTDVYLQFLIGQETWLAVYQLIIWAGDMWSLFYQLIIWPGDMWPLFYQLIIWPGDMWPSVYELIMGGIHVTIDLYVGVKYFLFDLNFCNATR